MSKRNISYPDWRVRLSRNELWSSKHVLEIFNKLLDAERELAKLRERTRWIPVAERVPHTDGYYLAKNSDGDVSIVFFYANSGDAMNSVYWMPLPSEDEP